MSDDVETPKNSDMAFALAAAMVAVATLDGSETPMVVGWMGAALAVVAPVLVAGEIRQRRGSR